MASSEFVTKIFRLQHLPVDAAAEVVLLQPGGRETRIRDVKRLPSLGTIVVSASSEEMARVEALLKELDVPSRPTTPGFVGDVELTFYLVLASDRPLANALRMPAMDSLLPALKEVSGRANVVVLETAVLRTQSGDSGVSGPLPSFRFADEKEGERAVTGRYDIGFRRLSVVQASGKREVSFERMNLQGNMVDEKGINHGFGLISSVRIPEGQRVVLGKSTTSPGGQSIFVVVVAKVL